GSTTPHGRQPPAGRPQVASPAAVRPRPDRAGLGDANRVAAEPRADNTRRRADAPVVERVDDAAHPRGAAGVVSAGRKEAALVLDDRGLDLERQRSGRAAEGGPVPEHGVTVLERDLVGTDRRQDPVDLEDPAARAGGRIAADLVDVGAEAGRADVVVELAGKAGGLQCVEGVRLHVQRLLGGAEDRLRLAFDASVDPLGDSARKEHEDGRDVRREDERTSKHESSFREGFDFRRPAGLLTRGSLLRRLPGSRQWPLAEERLPSQRRDRPGFAPGSLTARLSGGTTIPPCPPPPPPPARPRSPRPPWSSRPLPSPPPAPAPPPR